MSEQTPGKDPFADPNGYAGAGKRARRTAPTPDQAEVPEISDLSAPAAGSHRSAPEDVPPVWGQDPRPVAEDGLGQERAFWSDIFEQSGTDPEITAGDTGAIPVVGMPASADPEPGSHAAPSPGLPAVFDEPVDEPTSDETYDPFIGEEGWVRNEETGQFPPVTIDGQGLAEYTIEVPVVSDVEPDLTHSTPPPAPPVPVVGAADLPEESPVPDQPHDPFEDPVPGLPLGTGGGGRRRAPTPRDEDSSDLPGLAGFGLLDDASDDAHAASDLPGGVDEQHPADAFEHQPLTGGEHPVADDPAEHEHGHAEDDWEEHEERSRSKVGCLVLLIVLALLGAGLYFGVTKGMDWVKDQFASAEDFAGPGSGTVYFEIKSGETGAEIGRNLKAAGVVASVDAYTAAYTDAGEEKTALIQAGTYTLRKQMRAADVVNALVDPSNRSLSRVTIPEGLSAARIVETIAAKTDIKKKALDKALKDGQALGLPAYANGNPEGFLFPATYEVSPNETAASLLKKMVDRWHQSETKWNLEARAKKLNIDPYQLMIVASLVQAEGRGHDMNKIARVIYNRWTNVTGPSAGFLGIDASLMYDLDKRGTTEMTAEELATDSPYNLRTSKGLPPTPINNMGDEAIDAATHPADGEWEWYVTVNLKTGETKFATTIEEFNAYVAEYKAYCTTSDAC